MNIEFTHSGGPNNINPDLDLGGPPSEFVIATNPLNNLFDDVIPEENISGLIDYRCFYVSNNNNLYFITPIITLIGEEIGGSSIEIGSLQQNDIQRITFIGTPDSDGYLILQSEFGTPFNANFVSITGCAAEIQGILRSFPYCSTVTATATTPASPANPYIDITFNGEVGKRNTQLIKLISNRLTRTSSGQLLPISYQPGDPFNGTGDSIIRIDSLFDLNVSSYAQPGIIYVYNPVTGLYVEYNYSTINSISREFNLTTPLTFELGSQNPNSGSLYICYDYVYVPVVEKSAYVKITKIQQGSPINTSSQFIVNSTTAPVNISFGTTPIALGTIFAQESAYIWAKRTTPSNTASLQNDYFSLELTGTLLIP